MPSYTDIQCRFLQMEKDDDVYQGNQLHVHIILRVIIYTPGATRNFSRATAISLLMSRWATMPLLDIILSLVVAKKLLIRTGNSQSDRKQFFV